MSDPLDEVRVHAARAVEIAAPTTLAHLLGQSTLALFDELDRAADVLDAARALAIRLRANGVTTLTAEEFALLAAVDAQAGRRVVD